LREFGRRPDPFQSDPPKTYSGMAPIMAHLRVCHNLVDVGKRLAACLRRHSDCPASRGLTVRPRLTMVSVYQPSTGTAGTTGTWAYSGAFDAARDADGADSADAHIHHVHQSSGFLNRVHWFDSGRGHALESI
jgi:hypothetical protein